MDFQFIIPCSNSDLLNSEGDNYYVKQVYDAREIPEQLQICKKEAISGTPFYLFDHFDCYFSIIENANNISQTTLFRSFDLLFHTVDKIGKQLITFLDSNDAASSNNRNSYLNLTKMSLFLYIGIVKAIDHIHNQAQVDSGQFKKSKKSQTDNLDGFDCKDWDRKRFKFLVQLYNIIQLPLEKLWNPPVAEESFVNLFCDISYRTLEFYPQKDKSMSDSVFQILGTAIKRYNHAMSFPVRIMQILRTTENALGAIARGVFLLYEEFGITSIFSVLIDDIVDTLSMDAGDNQISKNFSTFLTELGIEAPKLIIPHLPKLGEELLNLESHVLRNCILQLMGDVITRELTKEDLSEEFKEIRNEFLEDLLTHINDVSAHVRSKVLQIWNFMKEENAVPLAFLTRVLVGAVDRLEDKSSMVRRFAIILVKSFLERNPFAAKLTLAELIKKHEEETQKLEALRAKMVEESKKVMELDKHWETVVPELSDIVGEMIKQVEQNPPAEPAEDEGNFEDIIATIANLLTEKKYREAAALVNKADNIAGNQDLRSTLTFEQQVLYYLTLLKSYLLISNGCKEDNEEFVTQENTVKFLEDSIEFSKIITKAVPKIQDFLLSKTNSDVFEAVDFFTTGYLFAIKGTESGMRKMLYLVWSTDKEKRDAVVNAYKRVLFQTDLTGRSHAIQVVKNISAFFEDLTQGHYAAMEVLIKEWVEGGDIDPQIIQVLFERFTMKLEGTSKNESRQALQLLIVASSAKSTIATANINIIESIGFEERGLKDPRIFVGCLSFILNSVPSKVKSKFYKRYENNHLLVQKTLNNFHKYFFHPSIEDFDSIGIKSIDFFYHLCQGPDIICQNLIIGLHKKIKSYAKKIQESSGKSQLSQTSDSTQATQSQTITQSQISTQTTPEEFKIKVPVFLISRFIFVIGYVTMKEMIFLDIDVYNNLKFRQDLQEENDNKLKKNKQTKRKTVNMDMSASESLKRLSGTAGEPQQEPDDDLVGATAEDTIAEMINHICENVLLHSSECILPAIIPVVIDICKHPVKYNDEILQQAAVLTLIRFMSVSSTFCDNNMPFLMNYFNFTKNIKIKCNIIIGLSDLTFRFPNVLEPWTGHFYATLHETNDEIRLTAVKMLSQLILHEMIRVKGQIADLAMCIVDPHDEIKNITHQFFKEIANKANILYNVLPDIISKLSDTAVNVEEEKYHIIMRYILGLINKDKQVESLVDKLCFRFRITYEERQWRDISFCLSLLSYTEKTIKKLIDNIQYFKDKIQVDEVYQYFKTIIEKSSKLAKPEFKAVITEFESRLNECLEINDGTNVEKPNGEKPETVPGVAKKQPPPKKKVSNRTKNRRRYSDSSSDEVEEEVRPRGRLIMKKNLKKNVQVVRDEDSSDTDEIVPQPKKRNIK